MKKNQNKEPLFRKENTLARGVRHGFGCDFRHDRNTKAMKEEQGSRTSMHGKMQRGYDYTPLFRFLLSKVGKPWDSVYSEAVSRLDKTEPIFWMVAQRANDRKAFFRAGENSYYSGLYVDDHGLLQKVNPEYTQEMITACCFCCTHTFNGDVMSNIPS